MSITGLVGCVEDIDSQVESLHRLIASASKTDPELGAGMGSAEELASVQRRLDRAAAAVESLDRQVQEAERIRLR